MNPPRRAFTLIELMVVIGIVAILMSLLLPSVLSARTTARRIACGANLKSITSALLQYAESYDNRYPIARDAGYNLGWDDLLYEFLSSTPLPDTVAHTVTISKSYALKVYYCPDAITLLPMIGAANKPQQCYAMPGGVSNGNGGLSTIAGSKYFGMACYGAVINAPTPGLEYRPVSTVTEPAVTMAFGEWSITPTTNGAFGQQGIGDPISSVDFQLALNSGTTQNVTSDLHDFILNYAFVDGHIESFRPDSKDVIGRGNTSGPRGIWVVDSKYR